MARRCREEAEAAREASRSRTVEEAEAAALGALAVRITMPRTVRQLEVVWQAAVRRHYPGATLGAWVGEDRGKARTFLEQVGGPAAARLIEWSVEHWATVVATKPCAWAATPEPRWGAFFKLRDHFGAACDAAMNDRESMQMTENTRNAVRAGETWLAARRRARGGGA